MLLANLSDHELVQSYIRGNEESLKLLIKRHRSKIYSYIRFTVKEKELADDFFQDTFIKVINTLKAGRYDEKGKFLPWVMRIAHNLMIDHFRKQKNVQKVNIRSKDNEELDIFDRIDSKEMNVEQQMVDTQIKADVLKLIDYLPEEQKEVVMLRHFEDLSFKEIAEMKNISINTALGRMRYALINLRKLVKEHDMVLSMD
ncbi:MAG: RNA polymerase sigma factor [Flavobacteriales bacterium]